MDVDAYGGTPVYVPRILKPNPLEGVEAEANAQEECMSEEYLKVLAGSEDLETVRTLEMKVDSTDLHLDGIAEKMPKLTELKLNNSYVLSTRHLGTSFARLTVLWMSRCSLQDLEGVGALDALQELYASYNDISDLSPLASCEHLTVLDMEGNRIENFDSIAYIGMCRKLNTVTLANNPVTSQASYRRHLLSHVPSLEYLDDEPVTDDDRRAPQEAGDTPASPLASPSKPAKRNKESGKLEFDSDESLTDEAKMLAVLTQEREAAVRELALVSDGIKYAKVGFDNTHVGEDLSEFSAQDQEIFTGRPITPARPSSALGSRPSSAALLSRRNSTGSSRPPSANGRPPSANAYSRPPSSYGRPPSAQGPPGTASGRNSAGGDGGANGGAGPSADQGLYWKSRRVQTIDNMDRNPGEDGAGEDRSSDLTHGSDSGPLCGNVVQGLRHRKKVGEEEKNEQLLLEKGFDDEEEVKMEPLPDMDHDDILENLRQWKMETADKNYDFDPDVASSDMPSGAVPLDRPADIFVLGDEKSEEALPVVPTDSALNGDKLYNAKSTEDKSALKEKAEREKPVSRPQSGRRSPRRRDLSSDMSNAAAAGGGGGGASSGLAPPLNAIKTSAALPDPALARSLTEPARKMSGSGMTGMAGLRALRAESPRGLSPNPGMSPRSSREGTPSEGMRPNGAESLLKKSGLPPPVMMDQSGPPALRGVSPRRGSLSNTRPPVPSDLNPLKPLSAIPTSKMPEPLKPLEQLNTRS
mmetsp:Transcript_14354/g.17391  ORF Transcript_14354/g.17391 Transcript_14354/m.17391 type:complete len:754 (+) Transcript_14354:425-2686(+)|eukprot:CAMPEP_0197850104 /NCGR_PEP_ID=MMETSP1438-20131217/14236_1 /TAXON_ID=1461541 /ORGANISM="Pterosperma sp., Strain CCMP1384" /LENGTH=753 /DNA_ID=CAMNT_0043463083 /DNA_START=425 /DNA_END=2686 /DNA_ORIENTATION=+